MYTHVYTDKDEEKGGVKGTSRCRFFVYTIFFFFVDSSTSQGNEREGAGETAMQTRRAFSVIRKTISIDNFSRYYSFFSYLYPVRVCNLCTRTSRHPIHLFIIRCTRVVADRGHETENNGNPNDGASVLSAQGRYPQGVT